MKFRNILFIVLSIFILSGCSSKNTNKNEINNNNNNNINNLNSVDDKKAASSLNSNIIKDDSSKATKETSLNEIFKNNENLKCIFYADNEGENKQEVTYYIDSSKKRFKVESSINFDATSSNQKSNIYAILVDGYIYSWIDTDGKMSVGTKFKTDDPSNKNIVDFNEKVKLNCEKWEIDDTYFNLPANVNFQDYSTIAK